MQMSARLIGQELGLTAQETNVLLKRRGFLDGEPGNYSPTDKGAKYVVEKSFHRGTGGYDRYNRYWEQRTFDESILEELKDITPELKKEIRSEVALRRANQAKERVEAQRLFEQAQLEKRIAEAKKIRDEKIRCHNDNIKKTAIVIIVFTVTGAISYGVYRAVSNRKKKALKNEENQTKDNSRTDF